MNLTTAAADLGNETLESQSTTVWTENRSYSENVTFGDTDTTTTVATTVASEYGVDDTSDVALASLIAGVVMTILILLVILVAIIYEHCFNKDRGEKLLTDGKGQQKNGLEGVDNPAAVIEVDIEPQMKCHEDDPQPSTSRAVSPAHTSVVKETQPPPPATKSQKRGGKVSETVDRQQIEKMKESAENNEWEL